MYMHPVHTYIRTFIQYAPKSIHVHLHMYIQYIHTISVQWFPHTDDNIHVVDIRRMKMATPPVYRSWEWGSRH